MATLVVPELEPEGKEWPSLGYQICQFVEERAVFGPGSLKGLPYKLDDEKRGAIYRMYEVYPQGHKFAGRRRFKRCGVSWRKGTAKALALDTPIPTPSGWSSMVDLRIGDEVFDEAGRVCRVVAVSETFTYHDCYRVTFRDGSSIVADAGHRWYTEELQHQRRGSVKTTVKLAQTVRSADAWNHRIPAVDGGMHVVVSVERTLSVPVRCIAVDSPSHLFLAGEAMVPTHNTEWAAIIAFAELHPEGPVRCDGWDANGNPVGRPVRDPYIPMVAYNAAQTEELAYGALYTIIGECDDAGLFDIGRDRIIRMDGAGRPDGKCVALSGSPNANDGARTTFQHFDEPLELTTPVPTPQGWLEIGELIPGDRVYDRHGRPVRVLGMSPIHLGRRCYRVTFANGDSIVTDASHRWKAIDCNRPKGEQVVTTQQMVDRGLDTSYGKRWRLPRNSGFDGVTVDLPIDPYLLGAWLGDGATDAGYIHSAVADYEHMSADVLHATSTARPGLVRWLPTGLRADLRALGLLGDKRIPDGYLFADRQQRLDLLAGLMDTDGHTTKGGSCTFVQSKHELAEQVAVLVRSLGCQATMTWQEDARSRTDGMWKVHFSPEFCPFRLPRKVKAADWGVRRSTSWPTVVSIEPVESVPVRCIAVDSDDHLFLVGRGLHLTHNTHRMDLPRLVAAHETMLANIPKRTLDDPWSLETTTAGRPGANSVAEKTHREAQAISRGEIKDADLFYFHREANAGHNLKTSEGRVAAISEATGPVGEYGPGQFAEIARQWDRPGADKSYLERVWLNRWTRSDEQAFDVAKFETLGDVEQVIKPGALCTLGFDGARFRDATGFVLTDVVTGVQMPVGLWERPEQAPEDWEVPEDEVNEKRREIFEAYQIWQLYADPPHWTETVGKWAGEHPDKVTEWWTHNRRKIGMAVRAYTEAIDSGIVHHNGDPDFVRHVGNAGRVETNLMDDEGKKVVILGKIRPEAKFDLAMAAVLSWQARLDALAAGATAEEVFVPYRLR